MKRMHKFRTMVLVAGASTLFGIGGAYAAVQTVTASIKFLADLSWTQVATPNFGYVKALQAGTYALDTAGVVTPSGGGVLMGGTPVAGNYTIKGSGTQLINVTDSNYVANGASTPSLGRCKYGLGAEVSCTAMNGLAAPTGAGTAMLVGLTVVTTALGADNQLDSPHFDLTVVYQ